MKYILLMLSLTFLASPFSASAEDEVDYAEMGEKGIAAYKKGDLMGAMRLLESAAEHGYAPAQSALAYFLDKAGHDAEAFKWYQEAAQGGHPDGQYGLAMLYASGDGVKKDDDQARTWMLKAVEQNQADALRMYASALEEGSLGVAKDIPQALEIYRNCHENGDIACTRRLVRAYKFGQLGLPVDAKKSNELNVQMFLRKEKQDEKAGETKK